VRVPRAVVILTGALTLSGAFLRPAAAQEAEGFAFLVRQPERESSVSVLPANELPTISATYATGESSLEVFVVPAEPPGTTAGDALPGSLSTDWEPIPCPGITLQRFVSVGAGRTVLRAEREQYAVYLAASAGSDAPLCAFVAGFVETFEFFLAELPGDLRQGPPPEFPAVVEIGISAP
jgi:hypothetical protein